MIYKQGLLQFSARHNLEPRFRRDAIRNRAAPHHFSIEIVSIKLRENEEGVADVRQPNEDE